MMLCFMTMTELLVPKRGLPVLILHLKDPDSTQKNCTPCRRIAHPFLEASSQVRLCEGIDKVYMQDTVIVFKCLPARANS